MADLPAAFGKYELLERIATGGMAEVYLARSFGVAGFEKRLVIKRLRPELAEDPRFVQMFIAEAKLGVHLNHPNIVQVHELGKVGTAHYIAMEHLHGKDLTRLVRALRSRGERVPAAVAVAIVAQVCRGLAYAHSRTDGEGRPLGLVHRDVSPHNVVVTFAGEVKLVDFGIARLMSSPQALELAGVERRKPGPGGGKYAYMSPEQAAGSSVDHRSDLHSAGIVLWELLVGQRLHQDSDNEAKLRRVQEGVVAHPRERGVEVDPGLWTILAKVLSRDPADRHAHATALEEDLRAWLFEHRHRVGRPEIADLLRAEFPAEADRGAGDAIELDQLVADVGRLDPVDRTPSGQTPARAPLPGHLRTASGERRPVVVLMVDIDGLTELSALVDPERLMVRKFGLLRRMRKIVDRHGGLVQQAVDDHVTILFGVPRTRADDADHAIECAMDLQENVDALRFDGLALALAIGVHAGEVVVSNVGRRVRYTARADTTRLARRLSAVADHGQILLSERVFTAVEGGYRVRRGPGVPCRGGKEELPSFLLEGRSRGLRGGRSGAWLRRGAELDALRTALPALGHGRGAAICISGDTGTGKSRFIREIRELSARRGTAFYGVRCTAFGTERPLEALRDLVAQVLGLDPEGDPDALVAAAERLAQLGLGPRELDVVRELLGDAGGFEPAEAWQAVSLILRGLADDRPIFVAFDDVHALPESQRDELGDVVRGLEDAPVLFLVSHRPEVALPWGRPVRLENLPPERVGRLVETLLGVREVDEALRDTVERTCEGNPRYVEEMLKFLSHAGRLATDGGVGRLAQGLPHSVLPHSLQALVTARIDALSAACKGLLQLAAVIGPSFPKALLAEAAGLPDPMPLLLELANHGLLLRDASTADDWAFASDLVHEAALRGTLGVQRRDYHRLVARAYEAVFADRMDPHLEALTAHCAEGGRPIDAARYAHRAGQRLERDHFFDRARRAYRLGLEQLRKATSPDDFDARVQGEAMLEYRVGQVELLLGRSREGHHHLRLALEVATDAGLPWIEARVHVALGRALLQEGRQALAGAHLEQARQLLRREPDAEVEREAVEALAMLAFEQGRNEDAERLWNRALALAEGEPAAVARCLVGLANRYLRNGDGARSLETLDRALHTARSAQDRILEGRVLNNIGLVHASAGNTEEALRFYRSALELREGLGYGRGVVVNHHNIGDVLFHAGDFARARVAFVRSRELAAQLGWSRGVVLNDVFLAYLEGSEEGLREAVRRARELGDGEIAVTGLWLAGRRAWESGAPDAARGVLEEALAEAERLGLRPMTEAVRAALTRCA